MPAPFVNPRNLRFLLYDLFDTVGLTRHDYFRHHNQALFDQVLDATLRLAKKMCYPVLQEMDQDPPRLENGRVTVHPTVRRFLHQCGDGGWIGAEFPTAQDGEQLPQMVTSLCNYIFAAANYSLSVYPTLNTGAAHLITSFGSPELIHTYLPPLLSGRWQGTMALTEPQAGSSLADIETAAIPTADNNYLITGQKLFISAGDHDAADNIVHLLLARISGAPAGVKGISLFVVPKLRPGDDGDLVPNDVQTTQIFHKLGYRGCPITELNFGQQGRCRGYLVGQVHHGLAYMFQMMNEARLEVGLGATAIAEAAYGAALDYTKLRTQGRKPAAKDPQQPQIALIEHADVKRMLLFQKSVVEGSLGLILQCARYADLVQVSRGDEKEKYTLLLDLLTPVAKSYPAEMGLAAVSQALQCFGGYGYCRDFPVEQYYRDIRIHAIHEGTTGIQALDLLGRKVVMHEGRVFQLLVGEIRAALTCAHQEADMAPLAQQLDAALERLHKVTRLLTRRAKKESMDHFLADATVYLELFSLVVVGWQWLQQGVCATKKAARTQSPKTHDFLNGKLYACRYFFQYELPRTMGLAETLAAPKAVTLDITAAHF